MGNVIQLKKQPISLYPEMKANREKVSLGIDYKTKLRTVPQYLEGLIGLQFYGSTSCCDDTDEVKHDHDFHLGSALEEIDLYIRSKSSVYLFTGKDEIYLQMLRNIADHRKYDLQTSDECYERLKQESIWFADIYHKRDMRSQKLSHDDYWGTHQQLLAGKVIADWVDPVHGPLDPIFGVLLSPVAGRVGPGNSNLMHDLLFDNAGSMAYHAAVHDAFGYLMIFHNIGPGYSYLNYRRSRNKLRGQVTGINFWKKSVTLVAKTQQYILLIQRKC